MKRIAVSLASAAFIPLLFWLGGYDFDERGPKLVSLAVCSAFVGAWIYFYPGWSKQ